MSVWREPACRSLKLNQSSFAKEFNIMLMCEALSAFELSRMAPDIAFLVQILILVYPATAMAPSLRVGKASWSSVNDRLSTIASNQARPNFQTNITVERDIRYRVQYECTWCFACSDKVLTQIRRFTQTQLN